MSGKDRVLVSELDGTGFTEDTGDSQLAGTRWGGRRPVNAGGRPGNQDSSNRVLGSARGLGSGERRVCCAPFAPTERTKGLVPTA